MRCFFTDFLRFCGSWTPQPKVLRALYKLLGKTSVPDPNPDPPDPHVLGLPDPDPDTLVRGMDPDPALDPDPDPSIIMQK